MQLFKTQGLHEAANRRPARSYAPSRVPRYGGRGIRQTDVSSPMSGMFVCGDNVVVGDFGTERAALPQARARYGRAA